MWKRRHREDPEDDQPSVDSSSSAGCLTPGSRSDQNCHLALLEKALENSENSILCFFSKKNQLESVGRQ